ncbi:hypothetical protein K505DRAFT_380852 [Melanomma pulvis-pyrius CBS 109.77]|uniref:Uncharacterized protein n=1 Tax=Melanomma pulvis-pyrius CBS 109.77 TaxID=1314802 RepID=A0A6A6WN64_9PLEO|nr:hypothetical protein K505DRAFT_380852 [Melanomma pulvis-pyrius CBS 109.77]
MTVVDQSCMPSILDTCIETNMSYLLTDLSAEHSQVARPHNKDSPNAKRQQELKTELNTAGQQRLTKRWQPKSRFNELKVAKCPDFRTVEDVDHEIARLQKQVDTGAMKLVDEKKALSEISSLNKARKNLSAFDAQQKGIDNHTSLRLYPPPPCTCKRKQDEEELQALPSEGSDEEE